MCSKQILIIGVLSLFLLGCGQKGPLKISPSAQKVEVPAKASEVKPISSETDAKVNTVEDTQPVTATNGQPRGQV